MTGNLFNVTQRTPQCRSGVRRGWFREIGVGIVAVGNGSWWKGTGREDLTKFQKSRVPVCILSVVSDEIGWSVSGCLTIDLKTDRSNWSLGEELGTSRRRKSKSIVVWKLWKATDERTIGQVATCDTHEGLHGLSALHQWKSSRWQKTSSWTGWHSLRINE
jgi:hypothetical protein